MERPRMKSGAAGSGSMNANHSALRACMMNVKLAKLHQMLALHKLTAFTQDGKCRVLLDLKNFFIQDKLVIIKNGCPAVALVVD